MDCQVCSVLCCAMCSLKCDACSLQCAVCSVQCAVFNVQCIVCSVKFSMYSVQCAVLSVNCAVCGVQCVNTHPAKQNSSFCLDTHLYSIVQYSVIQIFFHVLHHKEMFMVSQISGLDVAIKISENIIPSLLSCTTKAKKQSKLFFGWQLSELYCIHSHLNKGPF